MNGNSRKRASNMCVEDLHQSMEYEDDIQTSGSDEMDMTDKRQKVSDQDVFEDLLNKSASSKQRHIIIEEQFRNYPHVNLNVQHYSELIFGYIVAFDYNQAELCYNRIPELITKEEILQTVWHLASLVESITPTSRGFGQGGFGSSSGFGSASYDSGFGQDFSNSSGFGSSPIFGGTIAAIDAHQGFSPSIRGFTPSPTPIQASDKQEAICNALKVYRKVRFNNDILDDYVLEIKKRLVAMQLKELSGSSVSIPEFARFLGYIELTPAIMDEIREIVQMVGWSIHGGGINSTKGLQKEEIDRMVDIVNYAYVQI